MAKRYLSPPLISGYACPVGSHFLVLRPGIGRSTLELVSPMVVIALVIVEPVDVGVQNIPIAGRQPILVSRRSERINDVVQQTVVETALIEVALHFGEFIPGPGKTRILFFARVSSTPDMLEVFPDVREHMGPPLVATVALIPIPIPVLCQSNRRCRCQNQHN